MTKNFLDKLTETKVPPPPREMGREVHRRVNQWLLAGQVADLALRAFSYAAMHFGAAVLGMIYFSLTGKFPTQRRDDPDSDGNPRM